MGFKGSFIGYKKEQGIILVVVLLLLSCSRYQRIMKSTDMELKYQAAVQYYEKEDYVRALPLLEELLPYYRGTQRSEDVYYYYCQTLFKQGDYILAAYHFNRFHETYPVSARAEEALFLSAWCYYEMSPGYSLDQSDTYKSMEYLQRFIRMYPESPLVDSCRALLDRLYYKLEKKEFEMAKLYYKTEYYHAATVAFENFIKDWPASERNEEALMLIIQSWALLIQNSVEEKKMERIESAIEACQRFMDLYPQSSYRREIQKIYEEILKEKQKFAHSKS